MDEHCRTEKWPPTAAAVVLVIADRAPVLLLAVLLCCGVVVVHLLTRVAAGLTLDCREGGAGNAVDMVQRASAASLPPSGP